MTTGAPPARPPAAAGGPGGPSSAGPAVTIDPVKVVLRYKWLLIAAAVAGIVFGIGLHFLLIRIAPRYESHITFSVRPVENNVAVAAERVLEDELLLFVNTQVQRFETPQLLDQLAQDPRLPAEAPRWMSRFDAGGGVYDFVEVRQELEDIVDARPVTGTVNFRVTVSGENRDDPFAIASLLQDVYSDQMQRFGTAEIRRRMTVLTDSLTRTNEEIAALLQARRDLIENEKLESLEEGRGAKQQELEQAIEELGQAQNSITILEQQLADFQAKLQEPEAIPYSDSLEAQVEQERRVLQQRAQIDALETRLQALRNQGIMELHPQFKRVTFELAASRSQLEKIRDEELLKLFNAQVDLTEAALRQTRAQENDLLTRRNLLQEDLAAINAVLQRVTEIDTQLNALEAERADIQTDLRRLEEVDRSGAAARVDLFQPATRPDHRAFPQLRVMLPLGMVVVLGLVGLFVVGREVLDQRVKGPSDVAMIPRTRVLGMLPLAAEDPSQPKRFETIFRDNPQGILAEHMRQLRTSLLKRLSARGHKVVMIVPGMPGSGATSIATNLAFAIAASDRRVLIVDTNFRRPGLHKVFGHDESPGLSDALCGSAAVDDVVRPSGTENVDLLTAGSRERRVFEHLGTRPLVALLDWARERYDVILLDVTPAVVSADAMAIAGLSDASILVTRAMHEKRGMVARLKNELSESRAELLGVLVNGVRSAAGGYMRRNIRAAADYHGGDHAAAAEEAAAPPPRAVA